MTLTLWTLALLVTQITGGTCFPLWMQWGVIVWLIGCLVWWVKEAR